MAFTKKICLLTMLSCLSLSAFSQRLKPDTILKAGSQDHAAQRTLKRIRVSEFPNVPYSKTLYVYNDDLYKFIGTWEGSRDSTRVKIVFKIKACRFNTDTTDFSRFELVTGFYQQFINGKLIATYSYPENDFAGGTNSNPDTLNAGIYNWKRKAHETLIAVFLPNGKLKLAVGEPMFESPRNDKNFELKEPIILLKQN